MQAETNLRGRSGKDTLLDRKSGTALFTLGVILPDTAFVRRFRNALIEVQLKPRRSYERKLRGQTIESAGSVMCV